MIYTYTLRHPNIPQDPPRLREGFEGYTSSNHIPQLPFLVVRPPKTTTTIPQPYHNPLLAPTTTDHSPTTAMTQTRHTHSLNSPYRTRVSPSSPDALPASTVPVVPVGSNWYKLGICSRFCAYGHKGIINLYFKFQMLKFYVKIINPSTFASFQTCMRNASRKKCDVSSVADARARANRLAVQSSANATVQSCAKWSATKNMDAGNDVALCIRP